MAHLDNHLLRESLAATTFVVFDLESTGIYVGRDQIVEIAAVVVPPTGSPEVALNTLVRPDRSMRASEIHGLTDLDVADAPHIGELIAPIRALIANRVVAAHNASLDVRFIQQALGRDGSEVELPYICTMGLQTMAGIGPHFPLRHACTHFGIVLDTHHSALDDAMAAARLLQVLVRELSKKGIRTFAQLVAHADSRVFAQSLQNPLQAAPAHFLSAASVRQKPRHAPAPEAASRLREYLSLVLQITVDLMVSDAEVAAVAERRALLRIEESEMRAVHARVFSAMIARYGEDRRIDARERAHLGRLHACLACLGWAPGQ